MRSLPRQSAFTLLELILVIAILVFVGALAVPSLYQTFSQQTLEKSADRVRVAMGKARVRAIERGEIYAVFLTEGGSWFNIAPFTNAKQQSSLATSREELAVRRLQSDLESDLLPRGIRFAAGTVAVDARAAESLSSENGTTSIRPILFYPDGTSQDASIILQNETGRFVEIQLRGLTGLSSVIRLTEEPTRR